MEAAQGQLVERDRQIVVLRQQLALLQQAVAAVVSSAAASGADVSALKVAQGGPPAAGPGPARGPP